MAQPLPTNLMDNCDGFFRCFGLYLNTVTDGLFWAGALLAFCIVLFIATNQFGRGISFAFAGFTAIVGALFLVILEFLSWGIASAFILVGVISLVAMILKERG